MRKLLLGLFFTLFAQGALAQTASFLPGCVYNATPPTLADRQQTVWQCDINGKLITSGGGGSAAAVIGPTGAPTPGTVTDNAIVRWDGTTGTLVQDSAVTIADTTGSISFGNAGGQLVGSNGNYLQLTTDPALVQIGTGRPIDLVATAGASFVTVVTGATGGLAFSTTASNTNPDLRLYRDAANILALRNGTAGQTQRWYNSFTDASNGSWGTMNFADVANVLTIGTKSNGSGIGVPTKMQFVIEGVNKLDFAVTTAATWTFATALNGVSGAFTGAGGLAARGVAVAVNAGLSSGVQLFAPSDGVGRIVNFADNGFTALLLGPSGTAYPRLSPTGTAGVLEVKLADDSTYSPIAARGIIARGAVPTLVLAGGTCAGTAIAGGSTAGTVTLTGVCVATNTLTLSVMPTAPTGYACDATDRTLGTVALAQTGTSTTTAVFTFLATTGGTDVLSYKCIAY